LREQGVGNLVKRLGFIGGDLATSSGGSGGGCGGGRGGCWVVLAGGDFLEEGVNGGVREKISEEVG